MDIYINRLLSFQYTMALGADILQGNNNYQFLNNSIGVIVDNYGRWIPVCEYRMWITSVSWLWVQCK